MTTERVSTCQDKPAFPKQEFCVKLSVRYSFIIKVLSEIFLPLVFFDTDFRPIHCLGIAQHENFHKIYLLYKQEASFSLQSVFTSSQNGWDSFCSITNIVNL